MKTIYFTFTLLGYIIYSSLTKELFIYLFILSPYRKSKLIINKKNLKLCIEAIMFVLFDALILLTA